MSAELRALARQVGSPAGEAFPHLPIGLRSLDAAVGGGLPVGRLVEVYGDEDAVAAVGRQAILAAQRADGVVAYVDLAHAFDAAASVESGVDVGKLLVSQPDDLERALDVAEVLVRSGSVGLVVVDGMSPAPTREQIDGDLAEADLGALDHARGKAVRLVGQHLRKIAAVAHRTGTIVVYLTRGRRRPVGRVDDVCFGSNAIKFYASLRLDVRLSDRIVDARVAKNKNAPPFRRALAALVEGQLLDVQCDPEMMSPGDR